jgi:hypothetical protein
MLARLLKDRGVAVIEDVRAKKRDNYQPGAISVDYRTGTVAEIIDEAANTNPTPVAVVTDTGRVFVLSSGGSGQIVVVGEASPEQDDAVLAVMDVLHNLWGVKQPSPRKKKKEEPVVSVDDIEELMPLADVLDEIAQLMPSVSQENEESEDE